ncbi:MAG: PspC domain-containing protein [Patescibacteria group bacterium]
MKKLYRSKTNRVFGGVLGGLGEYFNVDPVILRLVFLFVLIFTAVVPGILFYIISIFVIPENRIIDVKK